jgi:hypothetical protein
MTPAGGGGQTEGGRPISRLKPRINFAALMARLTQRPSTHPAT